MYLKESHANCIATIYDSPIMLYVEIVKYKVTTLKGLHICKYVTSPHALLKYGSIIEHTFST